MGDIGVTRVGDLVQKIKGYGHDQNWTGIVFGFCVSQTGQKTIVVLTEGMFEHWCIKMTKVINESGRSSET